MNPFSRWFHSEPEPAREGPARMFTDCHRACDTAWAELERVTTAGDLDSARAAFERFDRSVRLHLVMEEQVLFPALEAMGLPQPGPTTVMREEHTQMRALLDRMSVAMLQGRPHALLDDGDTLLFVTQQHNEKEEGVLYPMADQWLGDRWEALRAELDALVPGGCGGACGCGG